MLAVSYLFVDRPSAISTCANKRMLLKFFQFVYTSTVVKGIADSLQLAGFPGVFVSQLRLLDRLQADLTCLDKPLLSMTETKAIIASNQLAIAFLTLLSNFYTRVDSAFLFQPQAFIKTLAVQRVAVGEVALAVINAQAITDSDIALMEEGRVGLIPAFLAGVVPIFRLPQELLDFAALESTTKLNLPSTR